MPIREIRYELYSGELEPRWVRFFAIPRFSLQAVWSKGLTGILLGVGSIQLLLYTGFLYATNIPVLKELLGPALANINMPPDRISSSFLFVQTFIALGVILNAGPKLLSPELRHHSLSIIFSRPISRWAYLLGKMAAIASLAGLLTVAQYVLLFFVMVATYPEDHSFKQNMLSESVPMLLGGVIYGGIVTVLYGLIALAGSAATSNAQQAGGVIVALIFGTSAAGTILSKALDMEQLQALGVIQLVRESGRWLILGRDAIELSPFAIMAALAVWSVVLTAFVLRKLRPVDIFEE